jgi:hypothetical protein
MLVLVTLFCLVLGYGANWKHQRDRFFAANPNQNFMEFSVVRHTRLDFTPSRDSALPLALWFVGERPVKFVYANSLPDYLRAHALFP